MSAGGSGLPMRRLVGGLCLVLGLHAWLGFVLIMVYMEGETAGDLGMACVAAGLLCNVLAFLLCMVKKEDHYYTTDV